MKFFSFVLFLFIWGSLFLIARTIGLTDLSFEELQHLIAQFNYLAPIIFIFLFSVRLILFIPSSIFIIVGAMFFPPFMNIIFSLISMFITETIIYWIGNTFTDTKLHRYFHDKYPVIYEKLNKNSLNYLFILVATPLAPTDATCFLAASLKIPYQTYIRTVLLGTLPIILLYTLFGKLILISPLFVGIISIIGFMIMIFLYKKYKHLFLVVS